MRIVGGRVFAEILHGDGLVAQDDDFLGIFDPALSDVGFVDNEILGLVLKVVS